MQNKLVFRQLSRYVCFFVLITNKRMVKILEKLRDFRGDSVISEDVGNIKQVQTLINEFNFDKLRFGGSGGMRGKSLLNEKAILILSLYLSECCKRMQSSSSRIDFSLDTGIEECACKGFCRPLLFSIRKRLMYCLLLPSSIVVFMKDSRSSFTFNWQQQCKRLKIIQTQISIRT